MNSNRCSSRPGLKDRNEPPTVLAMVLGASTRIDGVEGDDSDLRYTGVPCTGPLSSPTEFEVPLANVLFGRETIGKSKGEGMNSCFRFLLKDLTQFVDDILKLLVSYIDDT